MTVKMSNVPQQKRTGDLVMGAASNSAFDPTDFLDSFDGLQLDDSFHSNETLMTEEMFEKAQKCDDWELLSDVASVLSFATTNATCTYADIAKRTDIQRSNRAVLPKERSHVRVAVPKRQTKKETREKDGDVILSMRNGLVMDDYFCMEGVKCARGGKTALMFKGNSKTSKQMKKRMHTVKKTRFPNH